VRDILDRPKKESVSASFSNKNKNKHKKNTKNKHKNTKKEALRVGLPPFLRHFRHFRTFALSHFRTFALSQTAATIFRIPFEPASRFQVFRFLSSPLSVLRLRMANVIQPQPTASAAAAADKTTRDGGYYVGQVDGHTRTFHGKGRYTRGNGDAYDGDWVQGKEHGTGTLVCADGDSYTGEWATGNPHGNGKTTFADGAVYDGEWDEGVPHGHCKATFANGDVYEGEWAYGKENGTGKLTCTNGTVYDGLWTCGRPSGKCTPPMDAGDVAAEARRPATFARTL
jgi:hypothetical protein